MSDGKDKFEDIFDRQVTFMEELRDNDKLPEWPVDLTTKPGQRLAKEMIFNIIEELAEASFTLKNRAHHISDNRTVDLAHYREELGDALAYFVELCVFSDIDVIQLYNEYCRKNTIVRKRLRDGY